jgi:ribonuclease HI
MLTYVVCVIAQTDVVKYMLSRPILSGKLGKWRLSLVEFNLVYVPQKAVKGQALADFLADHPCTDVIDFNESLLLEVTPRKLFFDGSKSEQGAGIGVVLESPMGVKTQMILRLDQQCSHNQAEYKAFIFGLELLLEMKIFYVQIYGDSQLVVRQITREYKCGSVILASYLIAAQQLLQQFNECSIQHIPREENADANRMAQNAFGYKVNLGDNEKSGEITSKSLLFVLNRNLGTYMFYLELDENDWRAPIVSYLRNPNGCNDNTLKLKARKYVLMGEPENVLYKRGVEACC